jgi:hypothetical protein
MKTPRRRHGGQVSFLHSLAEWAARVLSEIGNEFAPELPETARLHLKQTWKLNIRYFLLGGAYRPGYSLVM